MQRIHWLLTDGNVSQVSHKLWEGFNIHKLKKEKFLLDDCSVHSWLAPEKKHHSGKARQRKTVHLMATIDPRHKEGPGIRIYLSRSCSQ